MATTPAPNPAAAPIRPLHVIGTNSITGLVQGLENMGLAVPPQFGVMIHVANNGNPKDVAGVVFYTPATAGQASRVQVRLNGSQALLDLAALMRAANQAVAAHGVVCVQATAPAPPAPAPTPAPAPQPQPRAAAPAPAVRAAAPVPQPAAPAPQPQPVPPPTPAAVRQTPATPPPAAAIPQPAHQLGRYNGNQHVVVTAGNGSSTGAVAIIVAGALAAILLMIAFAIWCAANARNLPPAVPVSTSITADGLMPRTPQAPAASAVTQPPTNQTPAPSGLGGVPLKGLGPVKIGEHVFSFPEGCHLEASTVACHGTVEDLGNPGVFAFRNDTASRGFAYLGGENMAFTDAFFLPHSFVATLNPARPMSFRIAFPDNGKGATTADLVVSLNWRDGNDSGITIPNVPINR